MSPTSDELSPQTATPLDDAVAIVTGSGSGGIGAATALRLAAAGANVLLNDRLEGTTDPYVERIRDMDRDAINVVANLMRPEGAQALVDAALERWGRLDILVNVVGGMRHGDIRIWDLPEDAWDFTMNLNLKTTFLCTKAVLPQMMSQRSGRIVNIASTAAAGAANQAHYATAKAGVIAFTRSCAAQLAPYNVNVNVVSPGPTITEGVVKAGILDPNRDWSREIPLGRPNEPDDIAQTVLFLCSDASRNMTGANLTVAGGLNPMG
jgi:NAD(P)-dependent dehydrogenase (short-subunit alcohol dehydrogenase family)